MKNKYRLTLFIDPELVTKARIQALKEKISLSKMVEEILRVYLQEGGGK